MQDIVTFTGRSVLFVGNEAEQYDIDKIVNAASYAKRLGFDSICVKRFDGGIRYYKDVDELKREKEAVNTIGIGLLGFGYCYGPRFGSKQLYDETVLMHELSKGYDGCAVADMEIEWDNNPQITGLTGQISAAKQFGMDCSDIPYFIVSTWCDPVQQNWNGVIEDLDPYVDAWGPQAYGLWLAQQYHQLGIMHAPMFPEFSLWSQPMESLHTILTSTVKVESVWIWEYQGALQFPQLTRNVLNQFSKPPVIVTPTPKPPVTQNMHIYMIQNRDTLSDIALRLGVTLSYLLKLNIAKLDSEAHAMGYKDSDNGSLIFPGTTIMY
jgi:hypothetical protein